MSSLGLTCGFKDPYLGQLAAKNPLKTREGRRLYAGSGNSSPQQQILHALRGQQRPVSVDCCSKERGTVTLWYTGYRIYETNGAAYDDSFHGSTNSWWPYCDKSTALRMFDEMHHGKTGTYEVVLFDVEQQQPAPGGSWHSDVFGRYGKYEPPEPWQPPPPQEQPESQLPRWQPPLPQHQQLWPPAMASQWQPQWSAGAAGSGNTYVHASCVQFIGSNAVAPGPVASYGVGRGVLSASPSNQRRNAKRGERRLRQEVLGVASPGRGAGGKSSNGRGGGSGRHSFGRGRGY